MDIRMLWPLARKSQKDQKVPIPTLNAKYDFWRGDLDLTNPIEQSVDHELRSFFANFTDSAESIRAKIRASIGPEQYGQLKWYPLRSAVFAIRRNDVEWIRSGLAAVAATDSKRFAPFLSVPTLALLYHAGTVVASTEVAEQFRAAQSRADDRMAKVISEFLQLPPDRKHALFAQYEAEVNTEGGVGFVLKHGAKYDPTYDLAKLIVRIRDIIAADNYVPEAVSIGDTLPDALVRSHSATADHAPYFERGTALSDGLAKNRGGAAIVARLRPEYCKGNDRQSLVGHLIECSDESTAVYLSDRAQNNGLGRPSVCMAVGPLLCITTAINANRGLEVFEDNETIRRFDSAVAEVLINARVGPAR